MSTPFDDDAEEFDFLDDEGVDDDGYGYIDDGDDDDVYDDEFNEEDDEFYDDDEDDDDFIENLDDEYE